MVLLDPLLALAQLLGERLLLLDLGGIELAVRTDHAAVRHLPLELACALVLHALRLHLLDLDHRLVVVGVALLVRAILLRGVRLQLQLGEIRLEPPPFLWLSGLLPLWVHAGGQAWADAQLEAFSVGIGWFFGASRRRAFTQVTMVATRGHCKES